MIRIFVIVLCLIGFVFSSLGYADPNEPFENAEKLREKLKAERNQAQKLQQQKERLERMINAEKGRLKEYNKILRNYQYNLAEAQKVIDAAEAEYLKILQRNEERESLFAQCVKTVEKESLNQLLWTLNGDPQFPIVSVASQQIAKKVFQSIQSERPRMKELKSVIQEKRAKQERILNKYMPADLQAKANKEELINEKEKQVEKTKTAYQSKLRQVEQLQDQLASWERRIAEINRQRRLAEQRRKAEEERRRKALLAQQKQAEKENTSTKDSSNDTKSFPQQFISDQPFADLRAKLPWPAVGKVIRPFGEFTHPEFKVKIRSPGIDVRVNAGTPIHAVASGEVVLTGDIAGFGRTVILAHGHNYMTVYGNITEKVAEGNQIKAGKVIGHVIGLNSNTLSSYHFEIRRGNQALNPQLWLTQ